MKLCWILILVFPCAVFQPTPARAQGSDSAVADLKSPDAKTRMKAAAELGKSEKASDAKTLAAALNDPDAGVRREVVIALAKIHQPESLEGLRAATKDTEPGVRTLAVQALVGYYTGQVPGKGFSGLMKKSWEVAKSPFTNATMRIDPDVQVDPKAISALEDVLADTRSLRAAREAAAGLGILVARPAVPGLVKSAHSLDEDLARESLISLGKIGDTSAGSRLTDLLDSPDASVRQDAALTVGMLRARDAVPKLHTMFERSSEKKTREKALRGLAYLGDPVSVPLFIRGLWSQDKELRVAGAEGLGRAGDAKNLGEVEKALGGEKDADARLADQFAIVLLGKADYLTGLVDGLSSKFHAETAQAYLVDISRDKKYLIRLYPYLNRPDATVRKRLCTVLMYTGDGTSIEHLERLTHDRNSDVSSEALRALRAVRSAASSSPPAKAG